MEQQNGQFTFSDDKTRLDHEFIVNSLRQTYWANTRSPESIIQSLEKSLCFGIYHGAHQIGFARAVTDECLFAWIADVFIDPAWQGQGLGKWLMQCVVEHPQISRTKQVLATRDAHGLYQKYGFSRVEMMTRPSQADS